MNIFVTGTDTGVGKTVITAGMAGVLQSLGFTVGVFKPIQAGLDPENPNYLTSIDLNFAVNVDSNIFTKCSYILKTPAAPVVSARIDGVEIDLNVILRDYRMLSDQCDFVLVEGAGGISVPISPDKTVKDLILALDLPVLMVARPDLGTINHTVLSIEYANKYNMDMLGIVISGYPEGTQDIAVKTAPQIIEVFSRAEILGIVPEIAGITEKEPQAEALIEAIIRNVDLEKIFRAKLPRLSD